MIVDTGKLRLLDAQRPYLGSLSWALFVNDVTITSITAWTDLIEASWAGYVRVPAGVWDTPFLVPPRSVTTSLTAPSFQNASGATVSFQGWALIDAASPGAPVLIAAVNLGLQVLPAGSPFTLAPSVTDTQE